MGLTLSAELTIQSGIGERNLISAPRQRAGQINYTRPTPVARRGQQSAEQTNTIFSNIVPAKNISARPISLNGRAQSGRVSSGAKSGPADRGTVCLLCHYAPFRVSELARRQSGVLRLFARPSRPTRPFEPVRSGANRTFIRFHAVKWCISEFALDSGPPTSWPTSASRFELAASWARCKTPPTSLSAPLKDFADDDDDYEAKQVEFSWQRAR